MNTESKIGDLVNSEIERVLEAHPYVRSAAVGIRETFNGTQVAAFVVPMTVLSRAEVKQHCLKHLPTHKAPSVIVFLPQLPMTAEGNTDYATLHGQWPQKEDHPDQEAVDGNEADVGQTFAGTLGLLKIGRQDNFFDLGGHSLLATKIVAELNERFGTSLTLKDVFSNPTVAALAARLKALR